MGKKVNLFNYRASKAEGNKHITINENLLTKEFLGLLRVMNNHALMEALCGHNLCWANHHEHEYVVEYTNVEIDQSRPDGMIALKHADGTTEVRLFFENKVDAPLRAEQLNHYLDSHATQKHDRLLVVTPRIHDKQIVKGMGDERLIFHTWDDVAKLLKKHGKTNATEERLVTLFLEAMEHLAGCSELTPEIINDSNFVQMNQFMTKVLDNIDLLAYGVKLAGRFDNFGGLYSYLFRGDRCHDSFANLGAYFYTDDFGIPLKTEGVPEFMLMFSILPNHQEKLIDDKLKAIVDTLVKNGFESNLDGDVITNKRHMLWYRQPITSSFTVDQALEFTNTAFALLAQAGAFAHPYFKYLKTAKWNGLVHSWANHMNEQYFLGHDDEAHPLGSNTFLGYYFTPTPDNDCLWFGVHHDAQAWELPLLEEGQPDLMFIWWLYDETMNNDPSLQALVQQLTQQGFELLVSPAHEGWHYLGYRKTLLDGDDEAQHEQAVAFTQEMFAKMNQAKTFDHPYFAWIKNANWTALADSWANKMDSSTFEPHHSPCERLGGPINGYSYNHNDERSPGATLQWFGVINDPAAWDLEPLTTGQPELIFIWWIDEEVINNPLFQELLITLKKSGFDFGYHTNEGWYFISYRQTLQDGTDDAQLAQAWAFTETMFKVMEEAQAFGHPYFKQFKE